jgi:hypothetical protein
MFIAWDLANDSAQRGDMFGRLICDKNILNSSTSE